MGTVVPKYNQELASWRHDPLGLERYRRYLKLFRLEQQDWSGLWVADLGCGPYGGMLSVIQPFRGYAVDVLSRAYTAWGKASCRIITYDAHGRLAIPTASIDVTFMLDVVDHAAFPKSLMREASRITRPGGHLYCFIHPRRRRDGSHRFITAWRMMALLGMRQPIEQRPWRWIWYKNGKDMVHDPYERAWWGMARREA